jgi:hypothetical protein
MARADELIKQSTAQRDMKPRTAAMIEACQKTDGSIDVADEAFWRRHLPELIELTAEAVKESWRLIEGVVDELAKCGRLSGSQFKKVMGEKQTE